MPAADAVRFECSRCGEHVEMQKHVSEDGRICLMYVWLGRPDGSGFWETLCAKCKGKPA